MKVNDSGSRFKHYRELQDRWELGIQMVDEMSVKSKTDLELKAKLEIGVLLLKKQIDGLTEYQPGLYSDALFPITQQISAIPKDPTKIQ